jgi:signal transduction histidine kinase
MESSAAQQVARLGRRRWWVGMGLAAGIGLLQAAPDVLGREPIASVALTFSLWVLELPLQVLALSAVLAHGPRRLGTSGVLVACLLVAVAIGALFGLGFVLLLEGLLGIALDEKGPLELPMVAGFGALTGIVFAGIWGLAFVSPQLTEQAQLRRLETEQLRVTSELARLRSQLEPHFLLNTLNTIAGLVTQDPREARRLLGCLGDLLRDSLEAQAEVRTLDDEIAWLRRYAEILESRHGDALGFQWDVRPDAGSVLLPALLLQPLVENAVQHGALCRAGGGRVHVHAALRPGDSGRTTLVCTVTDNGPGLPATAPRPGALGLHTVRRRLELRCPGAALHLRSSSAGTSAIVEIPLPAVAA